VFKYLENEHFFSRKQWWTKTPPLPSLTTVTPYFSHCVSQSQGQPRPFLRYFQQWGQFQTCQKVHSDDERSTGARISWTLGSCATLPVCQFRRHPTKHFHYSRPVSGVGCGESSSTVPMEYTIKCQYTCDHYVNVRNTQTDRYSFYHKPNFLSFFLVWNIPKSRASDAYPMSHVDESRRTQW